MVYWVKHDCGKKVSIIGSECMVVRAGETSFFMLRTREFFFLKNFNTGNDFCSDINLFNPSQYILQGRRIRDLAKKRGGGES